MTAAAELLVSHVLNSRKAVPLKSIAALLRAHRTDARLSARVVEDLTARAAELLPAPTAATTLVEREHVPTRVAAKLVGEDPNALHQRMICPDMRALYGWPFWDGHQFRFPLLALRAGTRPTFLSSLPAVEPAPIAVTLPTWCRRQAPIPSVAGQEVAQVGSS